MILKPSRIRPYICRLCTITGKGETPSNEFQFEVNKMATLSDGSVLARLGSNAALVVCSVDTTETMDGFAGLTVNFRSKSSAFGRAPSSPMRRDSSSNTDILISRLIDRSLRPVIPRTFKKSLNLYCNLLSMDFLQCDPTIILINAASAALFNSPEVPVTEPVAGVRVCGSRDGDLEISPLTPGTDLDVIVTTNALGRILMLEVKADFVSHSRLLEAIEMGREEAVRISEKIGGLSRVKNREMDEESSVEVNEVVEMLTGRVFCHGGPVEKTAIMKAMREVAGSVNADVFDLASKEAVRQSTYSGRRCDGRTDRKQLRPINCQVGMFNGAVHGCSVFQRGQTQVLATLTLDSLNSFIQHQFSSTEYRFSRPRHGALSMRIPSLPPPLVLHYEFAPYSTGNPGERGSGKPNRREIGHGALAERSLRPSFPSDFNLCARVLCEVLESNGSSSMAAVCAGSLCLMDGAVPMKRHVAGVAMGLMQNGDFSDDPIILTDINGMEDHAGDMDCKISGDDENITAIQLDVKTSNGIGMETIENILKEAQEARVQILDKMRACIKEPRTAPRNKNQPIVKDIVVPLTKRSEFVGLGGHNLNRLQALSGVQITTVNETSFNIFAPNPHAMALATQLIEDILTKDDKRENLEFGQIYEACILDIKANGVYVLLERDGIPIYGTEKPVFLPSSQLDHRRVEHVSALGFQCGQKIQVKYFGIDAVSGLVRLSRKVLFAPPTSTKAINPAKPR